MKYLLLLLLTGCSSPFIQNPDDKPISVNQPGLHIKYHGKLLYTVHTKDFMFKIWSIDF